MSGKELFKMETIKDAKETIRLSAKSQRDVLIMDYLNITKRQCKSEFIKEALEIYISMIQAGYNSPYLINQTGEENSKLLKVIEEIANSSSSIKENSSDNIFEGEDCNTDDNSYTDLTEEEFEMYLNMHKNKQMPYHDPKYKEEALEMYSF
jgi:hypothetical protein